MVASAIRASIRATMENGMAKLKTQKNAAKRFEFTATGKMLRAKHGVGHLRTHKSKRTLNQVDKKLPVDKADVKRLSRLLPYGA